MKEIAGNFSSIVDIGRRCEMWRHFWAGEVLERPLMLSHHQREHLPQECDEDTHYYNAVEGHWERQVRRYEFDFEHTDYLGEMIPFAAMNFGPDQFASWMTNQKLQFAPGYYSTNWIEHTLEDFGKFEPRLDWGAGSQWQRALDYGRLLRKRGRGKFAVGVPDLHSHFDALSALRGNAQLCMDFYDDPEAVIRASDKLRRLYIPMYEALSAACGWAETGTTGWIPFFDFSKYATIQCDFLALVGPEIGRKFIMPAIEEETAYLDNCIFHLDGPGELVHLDDILAMPRIGAIQWVSGAGQPVMYEWLDVLKKILAAGKGIIVQGYGITPDVVKNLHRELGPQRVVYEVSYDCETFDSIADWLVKNT